MEKKNISLKILMIAIIVALGVKTYLLCIDDEKVINQVDSYVQGTFYRQSSGTTIQDYRTSYHNPEIIGNLFVPETDFQVLVTQTKDNSFYLQHNVKREVSELGNPFLDYRNTLEDRKLLIYGHNSQVVTTDFQFLENYLDISFFYEHPFFIWQTEESLDVYSIVGTLVVTSDFLHMQLEFTDDEWRQHLEWLQEQFLYLTGVSLDEKDHLLILQTCYYEPQDSYLLVVAKKKS